MSWSCPHCEKSFSRKDSMKRHINNRHSNPGHFTPFNATHYPAERCQRFQLVHPFTCMVAGMTGSGKTVWVQSLLQQAQTVIDQAPERINLVLFTVAKRLHAIIDDDTNNRICQGDPGISGK